MSDFGTIQYVTTGLTLISFLAILVVNVAKLFLNRAKSHIVLAPENERSRLIDKLLQHELIDTNTLTKEHRYQIAIKQLEQREKKYLTGLKALCFLFILFFIASIYAVSVTGNPVIENALITGRIIDSSGTPIPNVTITIEGYDYYQQSRNTGIFQGQLGSKISKGSSVILNISHSRYQRESLAITINNESINLYDIELKTH